MGFGLISLPLIANLINPEKRAPRFHFQRPKNPSAKWVPGQSQATTMLLPCKTLWVTAVFSAMYHLVKPVVSPIRVFTSAVCCNVQTRDELVLEVNESYPFRMYQRG
mmetsp:Transcript_58399/g.104226  ORF Transcript_58399/g.104226 Transcript_58399/m.104226 type:complete len:107 (-) Transcript_58399:99-419(-)